MKSRIVWVFVALSVLVAAPAGANVLTSYTITLDWGQPDVTNIFMNEYGTALDGIAAFACETFASPPYQIAYGNSDPDNQVPSTTILPTYYSFVNAPTHSLLMGLQNNYSDVVLFMNPAAALLAQGKSWEDLFGISETDFATKIETAYWDGNARSDLLFFANPSGEPTGIIDPNTGQSVPIWFDTGGSFTVMRFSGGEQIGTGVSEITQIPSSVPEPATMLLLGSGLVGLAGYGRKKFFKR